MIEFKKLHDDTIIPTMATKGAAGFDLYHYAKHGVYILPGERVSLLTGVACAIPRGYVGLIRPRSGLAIRHGIDVLAGVIDSDYRGELVVLLYNTGARQEVYVKPGDRIAQLVVTPCMMESKEVTELTDTARGAGGFGSTGV